MEMSFWKELRYTTIQGLGILWKELGIDLELSVFKLKWTPLQQTITVTIELFVCGMIYS